MKIKSREDSYGAMTLGDARVYGSCFRLQEWYYNDCRQLDVYYLKLAALMKEAGCVRAVGRCYMEALRWSVYYEWRSGVDVRYVGYVPATRPERIYRIVVHHYVDLGSVNYLKKIKRKYDYWCADRESDRQYRILEKEYDLMCRLRGWMHEGGFWSLAE
ncbi:MAG: hypothetical protein R3Y04_07830 [Rikenellaceae bacterium]